MKLIDLTGERFGRLTVIDRAPYNGHEAEWICQCICGREIIVRGTILRRGQTSCRCVRLKHGDYRTVEYNSWANMLTRCENPDHRDYRYWGGRGIKVCERWHDYRNFLADMGRKPSPRHSIDRINNDGNYEPKNCRWATTKQQMNNRRQAKGACES